MMLVSARGWLPSHGMVSSLSTGGFIGLKLFECITEISGLQHHHSSGAESAQVDVVLTLITGPRAQLLLLSLRHTSAAGAHQLTL